ncbi:MAG: hypothetical protein Ta2B_27480 [Termitinemataceae bacterium]|nr:MAG: hypothetical protein Ta2B_27480 [Termitinemataceae bacterium]
MGVVAPWEISKIETDESKKRVDVYLDYSKGKGKCPECNKNPRRRAALYFCSPGELHFGFNTLRYAAEARTRDVERAEGIKLYGSNK